MEQLFDIAKLHELGVIERRVGRVPDVGRFRVRTRYLFKALSSFTSLFGSQKTATLLLIRSLSMRQFAEIPEWVMPGYRTGIGSIFLNMGPGWFRRNPWFHDKDYCCLRGGNYWPSDGYFTLEADVENATLRFPRATVTVTDRMPSPFCSAVEAERIAFFGDNPDVERTREAERVAMDLLRSHLTDQQRLSLLTHNHFTVVGSLGGVFRLGKDAGSWSVKELDGSRVMASWCIVGAPEEIPAGTTTIENRVFESWPLGDILLARKLLIETDEAKFREIGNRDLHIAEPVNRTRMADVLRLALLLVEHATDHEWWNSILRSLGREVPTEQMVREVERA